MRLHFEEPLYITDLEIDSIPNRDRSDLDFCHRILTILRWPFVL